MGRQDVCLSDLFFDVNLTKWYRVYLCSNYILKPEWFDVSLSKKNFSMYVSTIRQINRGVTELAHWKYRTLSKKLIKFFILLRESGIRPYGVKSKSRELIFLSEYIRKEDLKLLQPVFDKIGDKKVQLIEIVEGDSVDVYDLSDGLITNFILK